MESFREILIIVDSAPGTLLLASAKLWAAHHFCIGLSKRGDALTSTVLTMTSHRKQVGMFSRWRDKSRRVLFATNRMRFSNYV